MKEDSLVSWLWVKPGFNLNECGEVKILPIENYSSIKYEWAVTKLSRDLKKLFSSCDANSGELNLEISTARIGDNF